MKRWHVLLIALVACSWIGTGAWYQIRENRASAQREAMQGRDGRGPMGNDRSQWRVASPKERAAAVKLITQQLNALKSGDFDTALRLQSTELRSNFASAGAFASMMKASYSDFLAPKAVDFGRGRVPGDDSRISLRVVITAKDGTSIHSVYHLIKENNRLAIAGVSGGQRDTQRQMPGPGRGFGGPGGGGPGGGAVPGQPAPRSI